MINKSIKNLKDFELKYKDEDIEKELEEIAKELKNKTFNSYAEFEDKVADVMKNYIVCQTFLNHVLFGRAALLASFRNKIRELANIKFDE